MSKRPPDGPPDVRGARGETDRATYIEWAVAWLIALAAGAMLIGALAKLLPG